VVRVNRTRQPFSTRASPRAAALLQPAVARREGHDLSLAEHRNGLEVEGVERLARRQAGLLEVALDAAIGALGQFVLDQGGEEAFRRPALLVGPRREVRPDQLDGRQAEVVEGQRQAAGVDRLGGAHAASPWRTVAISS
jgi:hypothetical protein